MITVAVMGIAAAILLPALGNNDDSYVDVGVSFIVGDLDLAQSMAISEPSDMVVVKFDTVANRWWVAAFSTPDTPLTKPYSGDPYDTTMGQGRAYLAENVTFTLTNVTNSMIAYNAFGQLDQTTNPEITVSYGSASAKIVIDAETGFLTTQ